MLTVSTCSILCILYLTTPPETFFSTSIKPVTRLVYSSFPTGGLPTNSNYYYTLSNGGVSYLLTLLILIVIMKGHYQVLQLILNVDEQSDQVIAISQKVNMSGSLTKSTKGELLIVQHLNAYQKDFIDGLNAKIKEAKGE